MNCHDRVVHVFKLRKPPSMKEDMSIPEDISASPDFEVVEVDIEELMDKVMNAIAVATWEGYAPMIILSSEEGDALEYYNKGNRAYAPVKDMEEKITSEWIKEHFVCLVHGVPIFKGLTIPRREEWEENNPGSNRRRVNP